MHYAGIDLGATNLRAQVVDGRGEPIEEARRATPAADGATIEAVVVETLEASCAAAGLEPSALDGIGIGSIGPLDRAAGAVVAPPNVPADRIDVVAAVEAATGGPVSLHNDAIAGVIGERRFGDAPANSVYLTLSSGVGAGAVVDGHVLEGHRGNAAEVGHLVVEPDGRRCGCGGRGHWEAYCAGEAIPAHARDLAAEGVETDLELGGLVAADVFAAVGTDPLADAVVDRIGVYNAIGVADVVHAYAPDCVSVGGAVALNNLAAVLGPIRERLAAHLAVPAPTIRPTPLGRDAVLRGAVACALENHNG